MINEFDKLDILSENKTNVLYLPIEGKDVLVRTASIKNIHNNTTFYQSLLCAYSKDYNNMTTNKRIEYIEKLRHSIFSKIDKNTWSMSHIENSLNSFKKNVNELLSDFYKFFNTNKKHRNLDVKNIIKNDNDIETYKLIFEMISLEKGFNNNILVSVYQDNIKQSKKNIIQSSIKYYEKIFLDFKDVGKTKIAFYINKFEIFVKQIIDTAENIVYKDYIEDITNIDSYILELISNKFDRDIYFINSNTRMPYTPTTYNLRKRKSIILLNNDSHYEVIGKLLSGNRINREFEHTDSLIKCIYTYLKYPERISKEYPKLIKYLEYKSTRSDRSSDRSSDSDRSSNRSSNRSSDSDRSSNNSSRSSHSRSSSDSDKSSDRSRKSISYSTDSSDNDIINSDSDN
jgi:hypothetical protein